MKKPTQNHNWYIYKYIDPRPEKEGAVIYIGKGTHEGDGAYLKRMRVHWQTSEHKNHLFRRVLNKIDELGLKPEISVVSWHDSERAALDAEVATVAVYGLRRDGGTLCNLTYGGEGTSGFIHTDEERAKVAAASKKHWGDEAYRNKRAASLKKYIAENPEELALRAVKSAAAWTDEGRAAQAEGVRNRGQGYADKIKAVMANPERRKKSSDNAKVVLQDPDVIARRKITLKETMSTPEFRAALSARTKEALAKPAAKANQRAASKKMWEDPAYREKMKGREVSEETRKKIGAASKAAIARQDPETKARLSALRSQIQRDRHAKNRAAKVLMALAKAT